MIKLHPKSELLNAFIAAELPDSLSAAIAAHVEMCPKCQEKIAQLTRQHAEIAFSDDTLVNGISFDDEFLTDELTADKQPTELLSMDEMFEAITADDNIDTIAEPPVAKTINVKGQTYELPRSLKNINPASWFNLGKIARANLPFGDGQIHSHLLHIEPGGQVPVHTHKGFELTLLLDGSFKDELGTYHKGDFIWLDRSHTHQPYTEDGCLCMTVADDAQQFTQGLSKLLNPIGQFIY